MHAACLIISKRTIKMPMKHPTQIRLKADPRMSKKNVKIMFKAWSNGAEFKIPESAGVYRVFSSKDTSKTFYVGETGDLQQRLKFLFRCRECKNPHPCQSDYRIAYGSFPTYKSFCEAFGVEILVTKGMRGRIEIEEELQTEAKSNKADFYKGWLKEEEEKQLKLKSFGIK